MSSHVIADFKQGSSGVVRGKVLYSALTVVSDWLAGLRSASAFCMSHGLHGEHAFNLDNQAAAWNMSRPRVCGDQHCCDDSRQNCTIDMLSVSGLAIAALMGLASDAFSRLCKARHRH